MTEPQEDSEFISHGPCPSCGSSDANALYTDGHKFCHSCHHHTPGDGEPQPSSRKKAHPHMADMLDVEPFEKTLRGISADTFKKFGYGSAKMSGNVVHVAPYHDAAGNITAQHIRTKDKDFPWIGDKKSSALWGQHLWRDNGKMVVVTEGEMDAMSVSHMQGNRWPVVSIKSGAAGAKKDFKSAIDWLENFETVVICFDMDEPGQKAAKDAALVLTPGKAKIVSLPDGFKDANEMLQAGKGKALIDALWGAKVFRPDGIVTLADIKGDLLKPIVRGLRWWLEPLDDFTYGRRLGEVYAFGAGTGVGKTDFFTQQIQFDITELDEKVAVFMLEQQPVETAKRICGKFSGKRFHVPDDGWTPEELEESFDLVESTGKLFLYDHFGVTDWDIIERRIRYLAHAEGVQLFYIDHLTALATGQGAGEREELERIMAEIGGLVKELNIIVHLISHLATPDGTPHEEGGRVMIRHFKGSRAIGFWCHFMFGLERDQQAEDERERQTTTFRILKDRLTGQSVGKTVLLGYDAEAGRLHLSTHDFGDEAYGNGEDPFG